MPRDYRDKSRLPQRKPKPGQQVKVRPNRRADNRKQRVDRLAIQRPELNRLFEEAERHHGPNDVHHNRIADVRHRNAVAQGRRAERLAPKSTWSRN